MAVGDKIRTVDYNTVQTRVANILGTGSASIGYGQPVQSSQVTSSNNITVNEWGSLKNDIINIYRHQTNNVPNTMILPEAVVDASIRYNSTNAPVNVWDTLTSTLETNRVNALPAGRFGTSVAAARFQEVIFNATAEVEVTFQFASSTEARHFFNSGGRLRISTQFSKNISTSQNTSWETALSTIGSREWGGFYPDTSVSGTDGRNWHKSDGTYREFFSSSQSAPYGSNTYKLFAKKSNEYVYIRILLTDDYIDDPAGDPDNPYPNDLVDGTLTVNTSYTFPAGVFGTVSGLASWNSYQPVASSIGNWSVTNRTSAPASPSPTPTYSETMYFTPDPTNRGNGSFLVVSGAKPVSVANYAFYTPSGSNVSGTYTFGGSGSGTFFSGPLTELGTYTIYVSFVGSGNFLSASVTTV